MKVHTAELVAGSETSAGAGCPVPSVVYSGSVTEPIVQLSSSAAQWMKLQPRFLPQSCSALGHCQFRMPTSLQMALYSHLAQLTLVTRTLNKRSD